MGAYSDLIRSAFRSIRSPVPPIPSGVPAHSIAGSADPISVPTYSIEVGVRAENGEQGWSLPMRRLSMREIREGLRLPSDRGCPHRQIASVPDERAWPCRRSKSSSQKGSVEVVLTSVGKSRAVVNRFAAVSRVGGPATIVLQITVSAMVISSAAPEERRAGCRSRSWGVRVGALTGWGGMWAGCAALSARPPRLRQRARRGRQSA